MKPVKHIKGVFELSKSETMGSFSNLNPQKVIKRAQVLKLKNLTKSSYKMCNLS